MLLKNDNLQEQVEQLRQDLITQRWYSSGLRSALVAIKEKVRASSRDSIIIQQWYTDASLIYGLHTMESPVSRASLCYGGNKILTRARWAYAMAFMRMCGVSNWQGIIVDNPNEARMAFDAGRDTLEAKGKEYLEDAGYISPRSAV